MFDAAGLSRNAMAELSLREQLQPALLDRLIDDERLLTRYSFVTLPQLRSCRAELAAFN